MLRNILKSCNTSAASRYDPVDPDPNTKDLQEINNNFYSYSQDLRMWSFYETSTEPLVNKRRAVLSRCLVFDYVNLSFKSVLTVLFRPWTG